MRQEAQSFFNEQKYSEALGLYQEIQKENPQDITLHFDLGTTYYKMGKFEQAVSELKMSSLSPDSALAAKSWYNLGNTQFRLANQGAQAPEKIKGLKEAIASYKMALETNFDYSKARRNLEYAQAKLKEAIDQQKEEQKENKDEESDPPPKPSENAKREFEKAMRLMAQGLYRDAKGVLQAVIEDDETAQTFQSHLQRLEDVIDIHEGRKPERQINHSNLDNELGVI